jgi:hypothetical protein
LHEGRAIFFGTIDDMQQSEEDIVNDFLRLDRLRLDQFPPPPETRMTVT